MSFPRCRPLVFVCAFALVALVAGPATALSIWGQIKTTSASPILPLKTITFEADFSAFPFEVSGDIQDGGIAGNPYLGSGGNDSISFSFDLPDKIGEIKGAWLVVAAYDDVDKVCKYGRCYADTFDQVKEYALVKTDGDVWKIAEIDGSYFFPDLLFGAVSIQGGSLGVEVSAKKVDYKRGDFKLAGAALKVKYEPVIPEPSAALLFGLGAVILAQTRRSRPRRA